MSMRHKELMEVSERAERYAMEAVSLTERLIIAEKETARLLEVIESQKDIIWGLQEQLAGNVGHR